MQPDQSQPCAVSFSLKDAVDVESYFAIIAIANAADEEFELLLVGSRRHFGEYCFQKDCKMVDHCHTERLPSESSQLVEPVSLKRNENKSLNCMNS